MAQPPDPSTLGEPTPLRRTAIIHFVWGSETFHLICTACSVCRALDPATGQELDWVYFKGFQRGPVNPTGPVATQRFLVPTTYVIQISYGGRYRIAKQKTAEDLGMFPPVHPPAALR